MPKIIIRNKFSFSKLPEVSGVYWLTQKNKCLYVGQSTNINRRWNASGDRRHQHKTRLLILAKKQTIYLHYKPVHLTRLDMVESQMIQKLSPAWNILRPTPESVRKGVDPYKAMLANKSRKAPSKPPGKPPGKATKRNRGTRGTRGQQQGLDVFSGLFVLVYVAILISAIGTIAPK